MGASIEKPSLAELYEIEFAKISGGSLEVKRKINDLNVRYSLNTISALTKQGERIGTRYIFADNSFCDFYFEAPNKIFTGKAHNFKHIVN